MAAIRKGFWEIIIMIIKAEMTNLSTTNAATTDIWRSWRKKTDTELLSNKLSYTKSLIIPSIAFYTFTTRLHITASLVR